MLSIEKSASSLKKERKTDCDPGRAAVRSFKKITRYTISGGCCILFVVVLCKAGALSVWSCDIIDAYIMKTKKKKRKEEKSQRVVGHHPSLFSYSLWLAPSAS